jgi:Tol biopolymer transport system component
MNTEKKMEQCLWAAPKPPAPDGLLDKLQADVPAGDVKTRSTAMHRWFAPSGERISRWRVAAAAIIAVAVVLPLSYGATKLIKRFSAISQLPTIKQDFLSGYGGALSPDGKHFAGATSDGQLVVIDTSTGEQQNLAVEECWSSVFWSADGSEIAVVIGGGQENLVLQAISLKTGKTRSLMKDSPRINDWSPDGKFILAVRKPKTGVQSAVLINLENKEETVLAEEGASPRFSPNGNWVSYVTKQAGRSILHLRKVDGTSHVEYSDFPGEISQPLWSPDSTYLVFTGTQEGLDQQYKDLWALRVQGNKFVGSPFPVVPDVEQRKFYNWSQNGQLAYRMGFRLGGIFTLPVDQRTGKATGPPRQLVRAGGMPAHCWSPDGKQIAVLDRSAKEQSKLTFVSASPGEQIRQVSLPEGTRRGWGTSWSPDGKLIASCGGDREKRRGIFLITAETGDERLLVETPAGNPTWAPDSKTIAYVYKTDVYVVSIEDGKPRRITSPAEQDEHKRSQAFMRPVFAPDGRSVAYIVDDHRPGDQRILATTIDGKETREVFHLKNEKLSINIFDWSPDGRHIVFTPGNKEIWCAPTDGGEPFQIADLPDDPGDKTTAWLPKWSPTGDSIAFIVTREKYQYWVMTDFLPAAEADGR